ncbi:hypothetical protein GQ457_14G022310 [Hibiscus cannabinus]
MHSFWRDVRLVVMRRDISQEIVAGDDIHGGSNRLLSRVTPKSGVLVKQVNTSDLDEIAAVIGPKTMLVWLESPTNPRLQIADIHRISEIAHANGALVLVDNSIMSPVLSQPLELGADIGMHSATKFIAGHSDVMVGVLAVKEEREREIPHKLALLHVPCKHTNCICKYFYVASGKWRHGEAQLNPKHSEPLVWKMALSISLRPFFSSLNSSDPTRSNDTLVLDFPRGFQVKKELILEGRLQLSATQFRVNCLGQWNMESSASITADYITGSVKSLISLACFMSHASIPSAVRDARGLTEDLVRISVGIEDGNDLIADLDDALRTGPLRKDFGLIVGIEKDDRYKILKEGPEGPVVVTVEKRELKNGPLDTKFTALDKHSKTISINDTVKVLEVNRGNRDGMFSIGQTLRIRVGPLKGYLCRVLAVYRSDVTVKLDSKQKVLTVKNEHLAEVQGKSTAANTNEHDGSSSLKPFDLLGSEPSTGDWLNGAGTSAEGSGWNAESWNNSAPKINSDGGSDAWGKTTSSGDPSGVLKDAGNDSWKKSESWDTGKNDTQGSSGAWDKGKGVAEAGSWGKKEKSSVNEGHWNNNDVGSYQQGSWRKKNDASVSEDNSWG